ncbi:hypothetical protein [Actinomadura sp. CNU-125]|uniref:hypothetical protein n=1 Tax=Actinomadura sp. CNU-125 TaxID=1904961 RepID=UPI0021CCD8F6|nr:hypothetical protein [Actinomadura sp. CNU-125]
MREVAGVPGVAETVDPFAARAVSPDGRIALVQVVFDRRNDALGEAPREAVRDARTRRRRAPGCGPSTAGTPSCRTSRSAGRARSWASASRSSCC